MAACFKADHTRELINTHQPLVKTKKFLFENNSRPLKRWEARAERVWPRKTRPFHTTLFKMIETLY